MTAKLCTVSAVEKKFRNRRIKSYDKQEMD